MLKLTIPERKFQGATPIVDFSFFRHANPTLEEMPFNKLRRHIMTICEPPQGKTLASGGVALHWKDWEVLEKLALAWYQDYAAAYVSSFQFPVPELPQSLAMLYAPLALNEASWVKEGWAYVKVDCWSRLFECSSRCKGCSKND